MRSRCALQETSMREASKESLQETIAPGAMLHKSTLKSFRPKLFWFWTQGTLQF